MPRTRTPDQDAALALFAEAVALRGRASFDQHMALIGSGSRLAYEDSRAAYHAKREAARAALAAAFGVAPGQRVARRGRAVRVVGEVVALDLSLDRPKVRVKWLNAVRRLNGNRANHSTVLLDSVEPVP
jgi:hypothetical protein